MVLFWVLELVWKRLIISVPAQWTLTLLESCVSIGGTAAPAHRVLKPTASAGSGAHESGARATAELSVLAACALWLQRLREGLAALWHLTGSRILAQDTELLQEITQLLWNNAETPVRTQWQRL